MDSSTVVLIADSSTYMRDYIHKSLKDHGYTHIFEAVDGKDAIDKLMEHKVDLIISELDMPKVNGLELLKALSDHSTLKSIPIMVLKSDKTSAMFKEAQKIGFTDYIEKPFTPSELDTKIKSFDDISSSA